MPTDNNLAERIAEIRRWSRLAADMEATALKSGISPGESKNERKLREDIDALIAHVEQLEREVAELKEGITR